MKRLDSKVALVTGGASGLGKAIATRLASEGAYVVISDIQSDLGSETAADGGFAFLHHDVRYEQSWFELVDRIERRWGALHILVNNAGILGPLTAASPENTPLEAWRKIFAVNVEGVFLGCQTGIAALRRSGGGSIINIGSVAGLCATPYATGYGASKAAVRQLTQSVAQYCAAEKLNIRCNSVHPGNVYTPLWDQVAQDIAMNTGLSMSEILAERDASTPMGGITEGSDIASAVAFLASDDARRITGAMLVVDGGLIGCDTFHLIRNSKLHSRFR